MTRIGTVEARGAARSVWANTVANQINTLTDTKLEVEGITAFQPTLSGMAVGTGGSTYNGAMYVFIGSTVDDSVGMLHQHGRVCFGTSGTTFPTNPTIGLPSGFQLYASMPIDYDDEGDFDIGRAVFRKNGGSSYPGVISATGTSLTAVRPLALPVTYSTHTGTVTVYATRSSPTTTTPFTWAAGDFMTYEFWVPAQRV